MRVRVCVSGYASACLLLRAGASDEVWGVGWGWGRLRGPAGAHLWVDQTVPASGRGQQAEEGGQMAPFARDQPGGACAG